MRLHIPWDSILFLNWNYQQMYVCWFVWKAKRLSWCNIVQLILVEAKLRKMIVRIIFEKRAMSWLFKVARMKVFFKLNALCKIGLS